MSAVSLGSPPPQGTAPWSETFGPDSGGEIRGTKFNDLDGDGTQDAGEPGLAGVTIYLDGNDNGGLDAGEPSDVTDPTGAYLITGLAAGTYTVAEVQQAGWQPTVGIAGPLGFAGYRFDDEGGEGGFAGAVAVATSPDGRHLYVAGSADDALAVFRRSATTGQLTFVEFQKDGVGGVDGLNNPRSVTLSPDGRFVYVAALEDNAVAVFSRSATTGQLTFVEVVKDGVGGVDGLRGAYSVTVSPDGGFVYVAGADDDAVAVFGRSATSGQLTFVEVQKDGVGGVDGLNGAWSVTVSPDGGHVYVAADGDNAVAVFSRNATTGQLTFVEVEKDGVGGVDGLNRAESVIVSPDGGHVYVAGAADHAVAVFSRNATTGQLTFVQVVKDGVGGVDGLGWATSVRVSPDGAHLYATGFLDHAVAVFSRSAATGRLTFVEVRKDGVGGVDGLRGAYGVTLSPDGGYVYATGAIDNAVAVFSRSAATGKLTFVEVKKDGVGGVDGLLQPYSVTVSPDSRHVYVTGNADNAIAVFSRSAITGALTFVEVLRDGVGGVDGLASPRVVAISPDGKHVYVAGGSDDAVAVFGRNATTGQLSLIEVLRDGVGGVDGLDGATGAAVSPDGGHVYVTGSLDNAVAVFSRNATTGRLTFVEFEKDGVGGVDGLNGPLSVAVSPDGKHVCVTGSLDNAVAVFSRSEVTGELRFVEVKKDGVGGVDGLAGAATVTVSPDNKHVYIASSTDDAVAVFSRSAVTGQLTFVQVVQDGVGGVDGLDRASSVTLSPDGEYAYVTGEYDDAVAVFRRNATTGALTFVELERDDVGGVDGLDGATSVAVSPDGGHVYVASFGDHAVAWFHRRDLGRLIVTLGGGEIVEHVDFGNYDLLPPTADVVDVTPDPRSTAVDKITIRFNEAVAGFDLADLDLLHSFGSIPLPASGATLTSSDNVTWELGNLSALTTTAGRYILTLSAATSGITDLTGNALTTDAGDAWMTYSSIAGRRLFYNNSKFDGNAGFPNGDPAANEFDDGAIAPDKEALLPGGGKAAFKNYTSFSRGLNGIMVDVAGLPADTLAAADFAFTCGNDDTPADWLAAADPTTIVVRPGAGTGGSDRITLVWADNAIPNGNWLRVAVKANAHSGLAADDVFYFGSAIGETGDSPTEAKVNSSDVTLIRLNYSGFNSVPIDNVYDFNRDQKVNSADVTLCRNHYSGFTPLDLIAAPAGMPQLDALGLLGATRSEASSSNLPRRTSPSREAVFDRCLSDWDARWYAELAWLYELEDRRSKNTSTDSQSRHQALTNLTPNHQ